MQKLAHGDPDYRGCFVWKLPLVILSNKGGTEHMVVSHKLKIITPQSKKKCELTQKVCFVW